MITKEKYLEENKFMKFQNKKIINYKNLLRIELS